jgi:L-histidine Nalpha-methyltransferase
MNAPAYHLTQFAYDVRSGLGRSGQKQLPPSYLYDELGSTLFEAITMLPEYGLTRADARLLATYAGEIAAATPHGALVAELGSGTGTKTRHVLSALARRRAVDYYPIDYYPIDVSPAALRACTAELDSVARVHPINAPYLDGLRRATRERKRDQNILLLFLGSTIGNFDREAGARFLADVRSILMPGDSMLIGADLIKPVDRMLIAYDDPIGVTAAFNKNLLARMNRELGADFDLREFEHEVRWDEQQRRIEMHLRSNRCQTVEIAAADLRIQLVAGETIWTESSHKFLPAELRSLASSAGFVEQSCWSDEEWPFAECLWLV